MRISPPPDPCHPPPAENPPGSRPRPGAWIRRRTGRPARSSTAIGAVAQRPKKPFRRLPTPRLQRACAPGCAPPVVPRQALAATECPQSEHESGGNPGVWPIAPESRRHCAPGLRPTAAARCHPGTPTPWAPTALQLRAATRCSSLTGRTPSSRTPGHAARVGGHSLLHSAPSPAARPSRRAASQ